MNVKKIVVWFCASEDNELVDLIQYFSRTLDSPVFSPHITLLGTVEFGFKVSDLEQRNYIQTVEELTKSFSPLEIRLDGIGFEDSFWRCFYYLAHYDTLSEYHQQLADSLSSFGANIDPNFMPHLSLAYAHLTPIKQEDLLKKHENILLPQLLIFDTIKVMHFVPEDVNAWEELASFRLQELNPSL